MRTLLTAMALVLCAGPGGAAAALDSAVAAQLAAAARQEAAATLQAASVAGQLAAEGALERSRNAQRAAAEHQAASALPDPREWAASPGCDPLTPAAARSVVASAASRSGLPARLLHAVIERESGFRPCAVSAKGALGLMQLLPSTAGDLGLAEVFDPVRNAGSGAQYLARLLGRYGGDLSLALAAYNAGPARVDARGAVPDIPETRAYVQGILAALGIGAGTAKEPAGGAEE